ncbi:MAG: PIN domain-containing protein [Candidatus Gracilibacteria bacterium]|jgi:hypothetical protein
MILVDTSVWIEFLKGKEPCYKYLLYLLHHNEVLTLDIIFAELMQGALSGGEVKMIRAYYDNLNKPEITELLLKAAEESSKKKWIAQGLGLVDSTILFTAIQTESPLWTLDKNLKKQTPKELRYEPQL